MRTYPPVKERGATLLVNAVIAYAVFVAASGRFLPSGGNESVWFISALSLWFLTLLSAPWFVPPRDAIVSGVGALLVLTTMDLTTVPEFGVELNILRWVFAVFVLSIIGVAAVALFWFDADERSPEGRLAYRITQIFGRGEMLFSGPAVISITAAYQASLPAMAWLLLFWTLVAVGRPVERFLEAARQLNADKKKAKDQRTIGTIKRVDHPDIVRVRLSSALSWQPNRFFVAAMPDETQRYVISLFSQVQGSDVIGTGLCVSKLSEKIELRNGSVCTIPDDELTEQFLERLSGSPGATLVGFVVENSTIGIASFEVAVGSRIKEGDVVFARIDGRDVFYQIVGAETMEENFDQNPRGTHVVRAAQLGSYSPESGFEKYPWLPAMNAPLFSAASRKFDPPKIGDREFALAKLPSTNVEVVAKIDEMVEYHTAILGVTGTGKTELALDVVRQAVSKDVKVFCVDFTGEYRHRLADLSPNFPAPSSEEASELERRLFAVETGKYGAPDEKRALKEGIDNLRESTEQQVHGFLEGDDSFLAVLELAEITNTKASLRLTELYLSMIMDWAREHRRARQVMIVLEEAHTIVPEIFGSGFDNDTQFVVSRIGQIALQGRKYGVGLLVISQRTALVSKTILSQCNTFLTHSLIDQTSLNFLESVYSSQHTKLIPNLGRFEFLAFGKAIKAERPIILRRDFDPEKQKASDELRRPLPESKKAKPPGKRESAATSDDDILEGDDETPL